MSRCSWFARRPRAALFAPGMRPEATRRRVSAPPLVGGVRMSLRPRDGGASACVTLRPATLLLGNFACMWGGASSRHEGYKGGGVGGGGDNLHAGWAAILMPAVCLGSACWNAYHSRPQHQCLLGIEWDASRPASPCWQMPHRSAPMPRRAIHTAHSTQHAAAQPTCPLPV